ncbi:hypothetical protein G3I55_38880 [Streptomyces sp. SID6648]|nr:hypothetical protein [Streptomyces sp. SID6648]
MAATMSVLTAVNTLMVAAGSGSPGRLLFPSSSWTLRSSADVSGRRVGYRTLAVARDTAAWAPFKEIPEPQKRKKARTPPQFP